MIRRNLLLVAAMSAGLAGCATAGRVPQGLTTRPERTEYRETSRYDEVVAFMEAADRASPLIHLTTFGTTNEGRTLPLAVVGRVADASPAGVRASGKTVV